MSLFLKLFETTSQYNAYTADTANFILPNVSLITENNKVEYNPYVIPPHDYSKDYLTFVSSSDNNVIGWKAVQQSSNSPIRTISYSTDKTNWTSVASTTAGVTLATLNSGDKLYLKGTENNYGKSYQGSSWSQFTSSGQFTAEGNIMSLIGGDNFSELTSFTSSNECAFYNLFKDCTRLTNIENVVLPATTLVHACYYGMFESCTSLTTAPELPATTLADACYYGMFTNTNVLPDYSNIDFTSTSVVASGGLKGLFRGTIVTDNNLMNILPKNTNNKYCLPVTTLVSYCYAAMFQGCTSLTTAPELPATTLADKCYSSMFSGCTSLTTVPSTLPATTLANTCYESMFRGCTSLTTVPSNYLPATTLATQCYMNMFNGCTSLTTAPELLATSLSGANNCYDAMFQGCTSLTTAPELPATTLANYCYSSMFSGCTSLTIAPELPATTLANYCYYRMFNYCTSLTTAPELLATTLADSCYRDMFKNCSKLNSITCLATNISASNCTNNWVSGVASSGTFTKNASMSSWTTSVNGIPSNWTVVDAS